VEAKRDGNRTVIQMAEGSDNFPCPPSLCAKWQKALGNSQPSPRPGPRVQHAEIMRRPSFQGSGGRSFFKTPGKPDAFRGRSTGRPGGPRRILRKKRASFGEKLFPADAFCVLDPWARAPAGMRAKNKRISKSEGGQGQFSPCPASGPQGIMNFGP